MFLSEHSIVNLLPVLPCDINLGHTVFQFTMFLDLNAIYTNKISDKDVSRHYLQIKKMLTTNVPLHSHIHRQALLAIIAYKFGLDKGFLAVSNCIPLSYSFMTMPSTSPGIVCRQPLYVQFWQGLIVPLNYCCDYLTQMAMCYKLFRKTKQNLASCIYKLTLLIALHILSPECYDCLLSQYLHV